jgi:sporulation protein YlmC with PRC-barrel domain
VNSTQIKGLPVIGIAEGAVLGTIDDLYVDVEARTLLGFFVEGTTSATTGESAYLDPSDIRSIGADAVMVDNQSAMRGKGVRTQIGSLVNIDSLTKRTVMTESGTHVGTVAAIEFELPDGAFTQIEVSPGLFKTNTTIPIEGVVSIGPEIIVVSDAVSADAPADEAEAANQSDLDAQSTPAPASPSPSPGGRRRRPRSKQSDPA